MKTKKITIVIQKAIEQKITAVRKQNFKIKFRNFSESFKSEKFTNNFNSTSMILCFESIIKSNDIFVANSISISACISISKKIDEFVATKIAAVVQKIMKQKIVDVIETIKFEICVKNINFFDFTMFLNLSEFCISIINANFLHHLIEIVINYQKKSVMKILFQCFRDSVLT